MTHVHWLSQTATATGQSTHTACGTCTCWLSVGRRAGMVQHELPARQVTRTTPTKRPTVLLCSHVLTPSTHHYATPEMLPITPKIMHALWHARLAHSCSPAQPMPAHCKRPAPHGSSMMDAALLGRNARSTIFSNISCVSTGHCKTQAGRLLWSWHPHARQMIHVCGSTYASLPAGWCDQPSYARQRTAATHPQ